MLAEYDRVSQTCEFPDFLLALRDAPVVHDEGSTAEVDFQPNNEFPHLQRLCQDVATRNRRMKKASRPLDGCPFARLFSFNPLSPKVSDCAYFLLIAGARPDHPHNCGCHPDSTPILSLLRPHATSGAEECPSSEHHDWVRPCAEVVLADVVFMFGDDDMKPPQWYEQHACAGRELLAMCDTPNMVMYARSLSVRSSRRNRRLVERGIERGLLPLCSMSEFKTLLSCPFLDNLRVCIEAAIKSRLVILASLPALFHEHATRVLSRYLVADLLNVVLEFAPGDVATLVADYHLGECVPYFPDSLEQELTNRSAS